MAADGGRGGLSIRLRTTLVAVGVVAVGLVAGAAALLVILEHQMLANTDSTLRARLDDLVATARQPTLPEVLPSQGEDRTVVQVIEPPSRVRAGSADIPAGRLLTSVIPAAGSSVIVTAAVPPVGDGSPYRIAARALDGEANAHTVTRRFGVALAESAGRSTVHN